MLPLLSIRSLQDQQKHHSSLETFGDVQPSCSESWALADPLTVASISQRQLSLLPMAKACVCLPSTRKGQDSKLELPGNGWAPVLIFTLFKLKDQMRLLWFLPTQLVLGLVQAALNLLPSLLA